MIRPWTRSRILGPAARPLLRARAAAEVRRIGDARPVIVHQMGKVGSTAVVRALRAQLPDRPVFHVHHLSAEGLRRHAAGPFARPHLGRHYWTGRALARRFAAGDREVDVVTLVRDPVARNLSHFFQVLDLLDPPLYREVLRGGSELADRLRQSFLERYPHGEPAEWFDREQPAVFGIDVYANPSPARSGHVTVERDGVRLLLLRLEDLPRTGAGALGDLLRRPPLRIPAANSRSGPLAEAYRGLLEWPRLPGPLLDRVYHTRYARHFYRDDELQRFRRRWSSGA